METPSSTRRVTRSQTSAAANNGNIIPISKKNEEVEKGASKSRQRNGKQQDRSALIDITNDSPIVGLAMGSLETPSSTMSKKRNNGQAKHGSTPGSGEALLRGQVKTLLQKVEEEAELSKLTLEHRPFLKIQGLVNSPMGLLAPTPANTPFVSNLSGNANTSNDGLASVIPSPVEDQLKISQMVAEIFDGKKQEVLESEKNLITRSLLLDFSEKSEGSDSSECSSVLTYQGGVEGESQGREKSSTEDDDASIWSIQVNASNKDDEENDEEGLEEVEEDDGDNRDDYEEAEEDDDNGGLVDELCAGISKMSVNGEKMMAKFTGKHTRFVYNSDDELEGEEKCGDGSEFSSAVSPGILCLKGLPTPKGKHLRFPEDSEED